MDFQPRADRSMLAETLGRYLQKRYPVEVRHQISSSTAGWSPAHWREFAELGVLGGLVAESAGGFGGEGFDIAAIFEQLGRVIAVEPFLGTLMAADRKSVGWGKRVSVRVDLGGGRTITKTTNRIKAISMTRNSN